MTQKIISFQLTVPTDNGFIGRSCANSSCGKYFKIGLEAVEDNMYCPYCGHQFSRDELMTAEQRTHFQQAAEEQVKEFAYGEIDKIFADLARQMRRNKFVKFEHKPVRYRAKQPLPNYQEKPVDSELVCSNCQFQFQVYGIFGYCPGCGKENIRIYEVNLEIIKREVRNSANQQRALRHAYGDLVSTFEMLASARVGAVTSSRTNFQDLYGTRRFVKRNLGQDIFSGIPDTQIRELQRVFLKRHVYEHNSGIIGDRYVQLMPEDRHLLGQQAELSMAELEAALSTLRQILDQLVDITT